MPDLVDGVRAHAAGVAAEARSVRIDADALAALDGLTAEPPALDPVRHFLEGSPAEVAQYLLCADAINFGSGWFPTLRKMVDPATGRPVSGATTIAWRLTEAFRAQGAWSNAQLRATRADELADVLGQKRDHELMALHAQALRQLGTWLGERSVLGVVRETGSSAVAFATELARGMSMWDDRGCFKRAQLAASDLALGGVTAGSSSLAFRDLDRLTIFADNLVPHVLRCEGVLVYSDALAARIDAEQLIPFGPWEREIRGCAIDACERLSERLGVAPRVLDMQLWNRGQEPDYKSAAPRHRCRCVFY